MVDNADVVHTLGRAAVCELPGVGPRTAATLWKGARSIERILADIGLTGGSPRRGRQALRTSERQTV